MGPNFSGAAIQMVIKSPPEEAHCTRNDAKVETFSENNDENFCASFPLWDISNRIVHKNNNEAFLAFSLQEGEVDCWPLACPTLSCDYSATLEGECCPRCVSDPCLADSITYDIRKTCLDSSGVSRLSGSVWTMAGSPCTTCKCKVTGCPGDNHSSHNCQRKLAGGQSLRFLNAQVPRAMVETEVAFTSHRRSMSE